MKILNRILSVLVLIAALGAAVIAYLLFQKREQMLLGWEQMAKTVCQTAAALDAQSATAAGFNQDKLSHRLPLEELQRNLAILSAASKRVLEKRDSLAETLKKVADISEVPSVDLAALKSLDQTDAVLKVVVDGVRKTRERNEKIMLSYIDVGTSLDVTGVSLASLKDAGGADEFKGRVKEQISRRHRKISVYERGYRDVAPHVGVSSLDFGETRYKASVESVTAAAKQQSANYSRLQGTLAAREKELKSANADISRKTTRIRECEALIAKLQGDIVHLKGKLNPTKNKIIEDYIYDRTPLRSLYAEIRGTVRKVDLKWGFVVIDIGRKHDVRRMIAGKELSDIVAFPMDRTMTIVRGDKTNNSQVIGKIKIVDVHDTYSIARIEPGSLDDRTVLEGDTVFFSDKDLDEFVPVQKTGASH